MLQHVRLGCWYLPTPLFELEPHHYHYHARVSCLLLESHHMNARITDLHAHIWPLCISGNPSSHPHACCKSLTRCTIYSALWFYFSNRILWRLASNSLCILGIILNAGFSCLCLPNTGNIGTDHYAYFIWCWGLKPVLHVD